MASFSPILSFLRRDKKRGGGGEENEREGAIICIQCAAPPLVCLTECSFLVDFYNGGEELLNNL